MSGNALSGKNGNAKVSGGADLVELTGWTYTPSVAVPKWASNSTSGVKTGLVGTKDSSGTLECKVPASDANHLPFRPGSEAVLELHLDQTGFNYVKVTAIIREMPIDTKIDPDGEAIRVSFNFEGISNPLYFGVLAPPGSSSGH